MTIVQDKLFIDGQWVAPAGTGTIEVIEAHTEELLGTAPDGTTADIDRAVAAAREPVGVVGGIVPWNVPLFVTMLKLAPSLASGSTMVLKPAPETALDAYLLAECVQEAGVPAGVLNIVAAGREVGEHLVTHPDID